MVAVLWTLNGTHSGEYLGVPPTGKHVSFKMAEFMKITNGTISEYWNVPDATDLLIDIGYLVKNNATNTTTTAAGAQ
jgi:predicted ester cyclase